MTSFVSRRALFTSHRTNKPQAPTPLTPSRGAAGATGSRKGHLKTSSNHPIQERGSALPDPAMVKMPTTSSEKGKLSTSTRSSYSLAVARLNSLGSAPRGSEAINDEEATLDSETVEPRATTSNLPQKLGASVSSYRQHSPGTI